ncbi:MAG: ATP-binding protein [Anaerolineae bacterium]
MSPVPKVYGDEFRTRQVLNNLLSNAIKFTPQGSVTISAYEIIDAVTGLQDGTGSVASMVWYRRQRPAAAVERFRQVDSSLTRTAGGTGLGLPISKISCRGCREGSLPSVHRVNDGSVFSITIPIEPMPAGKEHRRNEVRRGSGQRHGNAQPHAPATSSDLPRTPRSQPKCSAPSGASSKTIPTW